MKKLPALKQTNNLERKRAHLRKMELRADKANLLGGFASQTENNLRDWMKKAIKDLRSAKNRMPSRKLFYQKLMSKLKTKFASCSHTNI